MLRNLQSLTLWQRRLVFFLMFGGILMALVAVTWLLARGALVGGERVQGVPLSPGIAVRELVALPGDDAYPATVAAGPDGVIYTGSYKNGAIWSITLDETLGGTATELPHTREGIGAASGIAVAADGSLLVVDQHDADPRTAGGDVKRVTTEGVALFAEIDDAQGFVAPNDIVIDSLGRVYVSDPGRNEIWRFEADGSGGAVWWVAPDLAPAESGSASARRRGLTGLAYDATRDAIIVTDPEYNEIFRVSVAAGGLELLYQHGTRQRPPGFDGATVAPDGTLYVAALGVNSIARVQDNELEYLASGFRGASDVEFVAPNRLIVANFDQTSLAPVIVPLFAPQLPFALDVIELPAP
ncbi:MAG: SMP-30/gluconolactonase/LRE family protein [Anaerolineae bacterium]|nr:SMP-30/gluconolactonase/LRE family protein [Anaerolineae bacterium]